tara:strand:- start:321 stop:554 length:234 start_codon:yes stop_codon:yes gene_type:complete
MNKLTVLFLSAFALSIPSWQTVKSETLTDGYTFGDTTEYFRKEGTYKYDRSEGTLRGSDGSYRECYDIPGSGSIECY